MPLIRKKNLKRLANLLLDLQVCLQVPNAGCFWSFPVPLSPSTSSLGSLSCSGSLVTRNAAEMQVPLGNRKQGRQWHS